jgi:hypothetical protein
MAQYHSLPVTAAYTQAARPALGRRSPSLQSSESSVKFSGLSECSSSISFDNSHLAAATLDSPVARRGAGTTFVVSYGMTPEIRPRYLEDGPISFGSTKYMPPVPEDDDGTDDASSVDSLAVNVCRSDRSGLDIPRHAHLREPKTRRGEPELIELGLAVSQFMRYSCKGLLMCHLQHAQAVEMYKDRRLFETQKITCGLCQVTGRRFVLKNVQHLTLHLHMHNMPE